MKILYARICVPPEYAAGLYGFDHEINLGTGLEGLLDEADIPGAHESIIKTLMELYEQNLLGDRPTVTLEEREED